MKKSLSFAASLALLAGCTPSPPPSAPEPPPVPAPTPATEPVPTVDWTEWPLASGEWVYRQDARGSIALFGEPRADARLTVRCDRGDNQIYISRAGNLTDANGRMTLRAHSGLFSYEARDTGGTPPYVAIRLSPRDIMLDRIAFARGRFAVETTGLAGLAIPARPEFARVVEDCRR